MGFKLLIRILQILNLRAPACGFNFNLPRGHVDEDRQARWGGHTTQGESERATAVRSKNEKAQMPKGSDGKAGGAFDKIGPMESSRFEF